MKHKIILGKYMVHISISFQMMITTLILSSLTINSYPWEFKSLEESYIKQEFRIPMRDGVTLFTAVYSPKDAKEKYPILMWRTPYSVGPYGENQFPTRRIEAWKHLAREGFIFVYQDVRGRFMSEGEYVNMRPYQPDKKSKTQIDESTDTYDTIDWLIRNLPNNNGKVGIRGISYPGFYAAMSLMDSHPALVAASPQAPIADWFIGDDFHHNGAFNMTLALNFFPSFGKQRDGLTTIWPPKFDFGTPDGYQFFLETGPLKNINIKYLRNEIPFWNNIMIHGTYDEFWQSRNTLQHFNHVKPAVMTVGGWFDAEDCYGALKTYSTIEKKNPHIYNILVMGPWSHGGWGRSDGDWLGDIYFGQKTGKFYKNHIELPFFKYYLKNEGKLDLPEAYVFETGDNVWHKFNEWPPVNVKEKRLYLQHDGLLNFVETYSDSLDKYDEYISDPKNPVPYTAQITTRMPKEYMVEDQRFAVHRPDVLTYQTEILDTNITVIGPMEAQLFVSTSGTDADWIVKLIDVFPDQFPDNSENTGNIRMGGYQMLVRGEIMRGKFRNSYEHPEPFLPSEVAKVEFSLNDIFHTFKTGHRIMVQIQSSWFPLFDMNPQKFLDIYSASEKNFQKTINRVYMSDNFRSNLKIKIFKKR